MATTRKAVEECEFSIKSIKPRVQISRKSLISKGEIQSPSIEIALDLKLAVKNATNMELSMNRMELRVYIDDAVVATGTTIESSRLPAGQTIDMPASVTFDAQKSTTEMARKIKGKEVDYRVEGVFYIKVLKMEIPITRTIIHKRSDTRV